MEGNVELSCISTASGGTDSIDYESPMPSPPGHPKSSSTLSCPV